MIFYMGSSASVSGFRRRYNLFLNVSFLLVVSTLLVVRLNSAEFIGFGQLPPERTSEVECEDLLSLDGYKARCMYLRLAGDCVSEGYIDYLSLFYCNFGGLPLIGYCLLFLWLLVLFYLLGDTASLYFCSSLENLSRLLKLSPTIAGVTLLSLGNGAPDVFSSLVSFMGSGTGDVGLNTVLGGASFVTCVVVGFISILIRARGIRVNKSAFTRDVCFFFLVLAILLVILLVGKINLWGAIGFWLMYVVYVIVVYTSQVLCNAAGGRDSDSERDANSSYGSDLRVPILGSMEKNEVDDVEEGVEVRNEEEGGSEDENTGEAKRRCHPCLGVSVPCKMLICILETPLSLPRRLTIPIVCEQRWSKPIAVTSVTLAPILLSSLWNLQDQSAKLSTALLVYGIGFLFGISLGVLAYFTTEKSSPPKKYLSLWLAGGFIMSVIWSYIIAQELVGLLVSLGYIIGIKPSILGFTVLAWGNSIGDLITDSTMALKGGAEGAQIAISGCYAGPIFNILFGLGLSLIYASWSVYPSSLAIEWDPYLLETLGFLAGGLLWALVVLPWRKTRLDCVLGGGLIAIYLVSVSLRLIQTIGVFQYHLKHT